MAENNYTPDPRGRLQSYGCNDEYIDYRLGLESALLDQCGIKSSHFRWPDGCVYAISPTLVSYDYDSHSLRVAAHVAGHFSYYVYSHESSGVQRAVFSGREVWYHEFDDPVFISIFNVPLDRVGTAIQTISEFSENSPLSF